MTNWEMTNKTKRINGGRRFMEETRRDPLIFSNMFNETEKEWRNFALQIEF